jgi:hypothetical protein
MDDDPTRHHPTQDDPTQDHPMQDHPMHDHDEDLDEQELDRELSHADHVLSSQLRELLDPAAGLTERTAQDIDRSLRGRSALGAAFDLLGLGWWTATALLGDRGAGAGLDTGVDDAAGGGARDPGTLSRHPRPADPEGEGT